jgi:hypothetical protein
MNAPYLTRAEIEVKYPSEWVLIANPNLDRSNRVLGGHVVIHAPERFEFYRLIRDWNDPLVKLTASLYTGPEVIESELAVKEQGAA